MFWRGLFLGAAALLLAQWLHVASIINNILATPVGNTPQYVANSFVNAATHGELLTALLLVVAVAVGMSALWRITKALANAGLKMHIANKQPQTLHLGFFVLNLKEPRSAGAALSFG
jgi:hypothetical protein